MVDKEEKKQDVSKVIGDKVGSMQTNLQEKIMTKLSGGENLSMQDLIALTMFKDTGKNDGLDLNEIMKFKMMGSIMEGPKKKSGGDLMEGFSDMFRFQMMMKMMGMGDGESKDVKELKSKFDKLADNISRGKDEDKWVKLFGELKSYMEKEKKSETSNLQAELIKSNMMNEISKVRDEVASGRTPPLDQLKDLIAVGQEFAKITGNKQEDGMDKVMGHAKDVIDKIKTPLLAPAGEAISDVIRNKGGGAVAPPVQAQVNPSPELSPVPSYTPEPISNPAPTDTMALPATSGSDSSAPTGNTTKKAIRDAKKAKEIDEINKANREYNKKLIKND